MKIPRIVNAVGHIDDDLVSGANRAKVVKRTLGSSGVLLQPALQ